MVLRKPADRYRNNVKRLLSLTIALLFATFIVAAPAHAGEALSAAVTATLDRLYLTAFDEAIGRHATTQRDGTTYVSTGDINADWLRDSSAIVRPYIRFSMHDAQTAAKLRGVVARQAKYILIDPYANAFTSRYTVAERKFEVDSLLYPIWFAAAYYRQTHDSSIFTPEVRRAFARVLQVLHDEQHHERRSTYRHDQLANGGRGSAVRYTGMVWTGFRPSDDPARYHFNIPENMFAVVVMRDLTNIARAAWNDGKMAENAWGLSVEIQRGIEQNGTLELKGVGRIYAYEVDGLGHANVMDDANIPSLLSIPYYGYLPAGNSLYKTTRAFVLSERNPYYFHGRYAAGVGSPHTPHGYIWPLALCVQALTATDNDEARRVLGYIAASDVGDHRLHESFDVNWPEQYTRADFAWPNALYAELVMARRQQQPHMTGR
jgi:meiotically up-regulated gene 157 (Mug157) protein